MKIIPALIIGLFLIATLSVPSSKGVGQIVFTSTEDFNAGNKGNSTIYFGMNGIDQPSNWISYPNSAYYNGRTYVAWQGDMNYSMYVSYYDHNSNSWGIQKRVVNGATENPVTGDGHGSPSLIVDTNGFVHIFCCAHETPIQHYKTSASEDISSWTEKPEISGSTSSLTYPHPVLVGNSIYLIYRDGDSFASANWAYRVSNDGGETWGTSTTFINLGGVGTPYMGGTESRGDRIYNIWVWYRVADGTRRNVYVDWLNTTDGNVYCYSASGPLNQGPVLDKVEADTNCLIDETITETKQSNFGSLHTDVSSNSYILYRVGTDLNSNDWNVRFSRWTGTAWTSPENVTISDNFQNYDDFIVNNATSIEAFIIAGSPGGFTLEGGDIERWTWDIGSIPAWNRLEVILREGSSGKPLNAPIIPMNHNPEFKLYFNQRYFNPPANARLYAWGSSGFLNRSDLSFGTYEIETNSDNEIVPDGSFRLASITGDSFSFSDSDAMTFKWGNMTSPQIGFVDRIDWSDSKHAIENGMLNISVTSITGAVRLASPSTTTIEGNFDAKIRVSRITSSGFTSGIEFLIATEQCQSAITGPCTFTVDGILYQVPLTLEEIRAFTLTDGVDTQVGTTSFIAPPSQLWLRIEKIGNTITWYYRTTDSGSWTTDETITFTTEQSLFVNIIVAAGDGATGKYLFDNYSIGSGTNNVGFHGYRSFGAWNSSVQFFNGEIAKSIFVSYSGASLVRYIDEISVISDSGNILFTDGTDRTSGTTATITIPDNDLIQLHGKNWGIRITLRSIGTGSVSINDITVNTVRSSLTVAIYDVPWVLVFVALITLGLMGAFWFKRKRGG